MPLDVLLCNVTDTQVVIIGGGQSGLAAAHALRSRHIDAIVLEAGPRTSGSWPRYYDSLTLFTPARYSALPGRRLPGDPDRFPTRDEMSDYLARYGASLDVDVRVDHPVTGVFRETGRFRVEIADREPTRAAIVIAATGGFGNPHRPALPDLDRYTGTVIHSAQYRSPDAFAGQRVVVVGGGNSAVQIAMELAEVGKTSVASRSPLRVVPHRVLGRSIHSWATASRLLAAPIAGFVADPPTIPVLDTGGYRAALAAGTPDERRVFTAIDGTAVTWPDGPSEHVDAIILATGFRPDLGYLRPLRALASSGLPLHRSGVSTAVPGLYYLGLDWQRTPSSSILWGVQRDAQYIANLVKRRLDRATG